MDDESIVKLYWDRSENAISETDRKYGAYCHSIAYGILQSKEDAEESVNDTYMDAWNSMPPHRPSILATFLGKITRRISIDRWRSVNRIKRGRGEITLALEELGDCVRDTKDVESEFERKELIRAMDRFLDTLPVMDRRIFLSRYWYLDSIGDISDRFGYSQSKTASMLHRTTKSFPNIWITVCLSSLVKRWSTARNFTALLPQSFWNPMGF